MQYNIQMSILVGNNIIMNNRKTNQIAKSYFTAIQECNLLDSKNHHRYHLHLSRLHSHLQTLRSKNKAINQEGFKAHLQTYLGKLPGLQKISTPKQLAQLLDKIQVVICSTKKKIDFWSSENKKVHQQIDNLRKERLIYKHQLSINKQEVASLMNDYLKLIEINDSKATKLQQLHKSIAEARIEFNKQQKKKNLEINRMRNAVQQKSKEALRSYQQEPFDDHLFELTQTKSKIELPVDSSWDHKISRLKEEYASLKKLFADIGTDKLPQVISRIKAEEGQRSKAYKELQRLNLQLDDLKQEEIQLEKDHKMRLAEISDKSRNEKIHRIKELQKKCAFYSKLRLSQQAENQIQQKKINLVFEELIKFFVQIKAGSHHQSKINEKDLSITNINQQTLKEMLQAIELQSNQILLHDQHFHKDDETIMLTQSAPIISEQQCKQLLQKMHDEFSRERQREKELMTTDMQQDRGTIYNEEEFIQLGLEIVSKKKKKKQKQK